MKNIEIFFESPYWLLLMIPAVCLVVLAYRFMRRDEAAREAERPAMVLKAAEVILLTLIVAGLSVVTNSEKTTAVILADASDSMESRRAQADALVEEIRKTQTDEHSVKVLSFAGESVWDLTDGAQMENRFAANATDIAAAMNTAFTAFDAQAGKQILLLSDGRYTDGDMTLAVQAAKEQNVRVDVMHLDTSIDTAEAELTRFALPADAAEGQRLSATVIILSNTETVCTLRIMDGENVVYEADVSLVPGENTIACEMSAAGLGLHTYSADIECAADTCLQNNRRYACMNVSSGAKILLVDGTGQETAKLARLLQDGGNSVQTVSCGQMPDTLAALCEYGLIVLMNVDAKDLPEGSDARLEEYVSAYGRSVLTTGGENTYIYGGMKDTPFETFLPVKMSVEEKESVNPVALMLVMDTTDSMTRQSMGTPIEMARRGAIKCVDGLNSNDYVGVITFSDEAEVLVEMTSSSDKDAVITAINGIDTVGPDKLTKFSGALRLACDELKAFDKLERKHVIFITDGSPADADMGFDRTVKEMREHGITMSSIVVGRLVNVVKLLEELSAIGGGRCYLVEGADDLPDVMSTDTVLSQVEYTIDDPVLPQAATHLFDLDETQAVAQLYGYIRAAAKGSAEVALSTPEGRPLYAQWNYGKGKAASFMSDLSGNWSRLWYTTEEGSALIAAMISGLVPDTLRQSGIDLQLEAGGAKGMLSLSGEMEQAQAVLAEIAPPQGEHYTARLERGQDHRFEAQIPLSGTGRYDVVLTWLDEQGEALDQREAAVTHSWSAEYELISAPDGGVAMMELAAATGGAVVTSVEEWLAIDMGITPIERDVTLPLAIAVMACLLADIVMRRTKMKRLRSLIRGKKGT